ncbi:hypothetical protein GCM10011572_11610 [Pseudoduganella buxea]|uniref:Transposase n=1 Tax=Pseudoduganella buxea TaxID=1949069 RepID=A0ABQ1KC45_9BURK|nr:hypothetical protein GCM10011572_11610 [Pseudoduganella buxea]
MPWPGCETPTANRESRRTLGKPICQAIGEALDAKLALLPQQAKALKMLCKAWPALRASYSEAA